MKITANVTAFDIEKGKTQSSSRIWQMYNHAFTLAYEVISDNLTPTVEEHMLALRKRMQQLQEDSLERVEALTTDKPFDTYEYDAYERVMAAVEARVW